MSEILRTLHAHPRFRLEESADGILVVSVHGAAETIDEFDEFFAAFQPQLEAHAPARVLVDLGNFHDASLSVRWKLAMRMKENRQWIARSATFGLTPAQTTIARIVLRAAGRDDIRVCASRAEAEDFLREASAPRAGSAARR